MKVSFTTVLLILFTTSISHAIETQATEVDEFLKIGPESIPMPLYHDLENVQGDTYSISDLVEYEPLDVTYWWPQEGDDQRWDSETTLTWNTISDGWLSVADEEHPNYTWLSFYVELDRWMPLIMHFESHHPLKVYLNGLPLGSKQTSEPEYEGVEPGRYAEEVHLPKGKHLVTIKAVFDPENAGSDWEVLPTLETAWLDDLSYSTDPTHGVAMRHLTDAPTPGSVSISPDGSYVTTAVSRADPPDGDTESWIELTTFDGDPVQQFKGSMQVGNVQWRPDGEAFSYVDSHEDGADLWVVDMETGTQNRILRDIEQMGSYSWSPDGNYLIYSVTERPQPPESDVRRLEYLEDRRPGFRHRSFLYKVDAEGGSSRRLTAGKLTTGLNSIHPDGESLLFTRSHIDYSERPYTKTEYKSLDLSTMEVDSLFTARFGGSANWSPDGDKILVTGGPSMFDEAGRNLPEDMTPNEYDDQLYLYDPDENSVDPLSRNFDPAIAGADWNADGSSVYVITTEQSYRNLYRYDLDDRRYTKIETGVDIIGQFDLAKDTDLAIFTGSGISDPPAVYTFDHNEGRADLLSEPSQKEYRNVSFGESRDWTFENENGDEIDGHVYYPPGFDEDETYPVIVYYYGGVTPVNRAFGGRYPKEYYAAQGYLVYVLQPSGAIGYGQEFSGRHVRDWGKIVADEIIDGVGQFLETHDYADNDNVGAIGASYGGFMTMLLQTRTDMFTAAISHAGISNITSYWGEGFWGFQYSAIATADAFPWDNPEIYMEQSPIFEADEITTPLLLLHGNVDTNVPPGESIQMFTALQLLERDVAYVEIDETDHHVLEYQKYHDWTHTILAWFDQHLKGKPEWWEYLHE